MTTLRHTSASFAILFLLSTLLITIYTGFEENYGIEKSDTEDGKTVIEKLKELALMDGISDIQAGLEKLKKIKPSIFAAADLLGALAIAGAGVLKVIFGIVTFIPAIFGVITGFYYIPPVLEYVISSLAILYVGFILLSKYLRDEI